MSKLTDYLVERSQGLLKIESEINDWTGKNFSMFNTGSVEVETAEFLYGLVRILKPEDILDLGSHYGVSALYFAKACQDNGFGQVVSIEHDPHYMTEAKKLWQAEGVDELIQDIRISSLAHVPTQGYDLILCDTEPQIRFQEVVKFFPNLHEGGFIFVHDLHRHMSQEPNEEHGFGHPFGKLPEEIKNWVKSRKLRPIHFPTPRGFMGFYKVSRDDYAW